jgi:hypothetical protein
MVTAGSSPLILVWDIESSSINRCVHDTVSRRSERDLRDHKCNVVRRDGLERPSSRLRLSKKASVGLRCD